MKVGLKLGIKSNPYPPLVGAKCSFTANSVSKITAIPNAGILLRNKKSGNIILSKPFLIYAAIAPNTFPKIQPTIIAGNCKAIVHHILLLIISPTFLGY